MMSKYMRFLQSVFLIGHVFRLAVAESQGTMEQSINFVGYLADLFKDMKSQHFDEDDATALLHNVGNLHKEISNAFQKFGKDKRRPRPTSLFQTEESSEPVVQENGTNIQKLRNATIRKIPNAQEMAQSLLETDTVRESVDQTSDDTLGVTAVTLPSGVSSDSEKISTVLDSLTESDNAAAAESGAETKSLLEQVVEKARLAEEKLKDVTTKELAIRSELKKLDDLKLQQETALLEMNEREAEIEDSAKRMSMREEAEYKEMSAKTKREVFIINKVELRVLALASHVDMLMGHTLNGGQPKMLDYISMGTPDERIAQLGNAISHMDRSLDAIGQITGCVDM